MDPKPATVHMNRHARRALAARFRNDKAAKAKWLEARRQQAVAALGARGVKPEDIESLATEARQLAALRRWPEGLARPTPEQLENLKLALLATAGVATAGAPAA